MAALTTAPARPTCPQVSLRLYRDLEDVDPRPALTQPRLKAHIGDLVARRRLTHPVAARYSLEECASAHHHQESGAALGKVLVRGRK